jgi:hypothetical protein
MDGGQVHFHLENMRNDDLLAIRVRFGDTLCKYNEIIHMRDLSVDELNEIKTLVTELVLYESDPDYGAYKKVETYTNVLIGNKRQRRNNNK